MVEDDRKQLDLEKGDFLYQVDQELFLVVMEERDDSYLFSVHGWRDISKNRAHEYVEGEPGKLYSQDTFEQVVGEEGGEHIKEKYVELRDLFQSYSEGMDSETGEAFSMEDH